MAIGMRPVAVRMLTVKEASRILHVHKRAIRRWCDEGILISHGVNAVGLPLVAESSVLALKSRTHE